MEINDCADQCWHPWCSGDSVELPLKILDLQPLLLARTYPSPSGSASSLVPALSPNGTPPTRFPAAPAAANSSSGSRALWEGATAEL